ncbi:hypothetical protein ACIOUE_37935 [Streptomyces xanthochromogenes]|uniref:hypothetical protein n=1 Tax=Streptomyces xanthochromogenes TaxID=67384 RepID=UPI0037FF9404
MLDATAIAVATGAAGNVIAYLIQGNIDDVRARIAAIFRRTSAGHRAEALRVLDEDAAALSQQTVSQADVTARWTGLLTAVLAAHPDARADIEALASTTAATKTVNIGSQHNHGGGTFIGGDHHGDIHNGRD